MILSFSKKNIKERKFVEKIWASFIQGLNVNQYGEVLMEWGLNRDDIEKAKPKMHTIRQDSKDRWKVGRKIHLVMNNRQPNYFQFAPIVFCVSTQKIRILWDEKKPTVYLWENDEVGFMPFAYEGYNDNGLKKLAINDGFDSVEDFFNYFSSDFEGKIIHWTDHFYTF